MSSERVLGDCMLPKEVYEIEDFLFCFSCSLGTVLTILQSQIIYLKIPVQSRSEREGESVKGEL